MVLFIGSRPNLAVPTFDLPLDKLGHFGAYAVLGALAGRGWLRTRAPAVLILSLMLALGAIDELNQRRVPGRSSELLDFVADVAGSSAGFALVVMYLRAREQRKHV